MITPHEHVVRTPALERLVVGDVVNDPDLELFNRVCGTRALNKALIGMLAPGLVLGIGYFLASALASWRRSTQSRSYEMHGRTPCERLAASFCFAVYYFYLPVALTWMSTGFVNSATHIWGDMPFADSMMAGCEARNNAFLMFPMLGENWHNNHHAVPGSLSTWVVWYQVDFVYLTGRLFELVGLASDLRVEVPHTLIDESKPPVGFPLFSWSVWALIFAIVWHLRSAPSTDTAERRAESKGSAEESTPIGRG